MVVTSLTLDTDNGETGVLQQIQFLIGKKQFKNAPLKTITRLISWKLHCLFAKEALIVLEGTQLRMALPPHWHGHPKLLYTFGWHFDTELPYLASNMSKDAVVFDIGANVGTWSLILSEVVGPRGKIFAYEPTLSTFDTLSKNVAINARTNILAFRYALCNKNDKIRLYHDVDSSRNSLGHTRSDDATSEYEEVPARTLDAVASELSLDKLDFIKIDVEGAEPLVFEGAHETLIRFKPTILFEVNPKALAELGFAHDSSWRILSNLGYRFHELQSDGLKEVFTCPAEMTNLWALHSSRLTGPSSGLVV